MMNDQLVWYRDEAICFLYPKHLELEIVHGPDIEYNFEGSKARKHTDEDIFDCLVIRICSDRESLISRQSEILKGPINDNEAFRFQIVKRGKSEARSEAIERIIVARHVPTGIVEYRWDVLFLMEGPYVDVEISRTGDLEADRPMWVDVIKSIQLRDTSAIDACATRSTPPEHPEGKRDFVYLDSDEGPHLVLPNSLRDAWSPGPPQGDDMMDPMKILDPSTDYGRACSIGTEFGLIPVGAGQALVLGEPWSTAWGKSPGGSGINLFVLRDCFEDDMDAFIKRAIRANPTKKMKDTAVSWTLPGPGLTLMEAIEKPDSSSDHQYDIPIDPGTYRILQGRYDSKCGQYSVTIYRLEPASS